MSAATQQEEASIGTGHVFVDVPVLDTSFTSHQQPLCDDNRSPVSPSSPDQQDRRSSVEWDASKVPPSRFQKRKGSIYAVPSSRDGHIAKNKAEKFHEKHAEMTSSGRW